MKKRLCRALLLCGLLASGNASAEIHALILTIGDYQGGIPKLKGVAKDSQSAREIAHLLGAKDENILEFHDEQLTLDGMTRAFDQLDSRVVQGDKVFIYYSGHGGRALIRDPNDRCAESLISVNGDAMTDGEIESRLKKLSERTQKIIAMFDACHSGGVATRALKDEQFTPKYWSPGGDGKDACARPINVLTRDIKSAMRSVGSGGNNYVYISAARDNEVSLDQPGKGGLATRFWLACMSGEAEDLDRSGGVTVDEIQACAQKKIDATMQGVQGFLPQHLSVVGNSQLVMTLAAKSADSPQTPQLAAVAKREGEAPRTLLDLYNGRDDRRKVELVPVKTKLRIGADKFSFSLRSSHPGYLYLLMAGSDGKTFDLLYPNKLDAANYIQAGQLLQFPRPNWELVAQGPVGRDHILAIVADAPRDLGSLPAANIGPFSSVAAGAGGKRGIQLVTSATPAAIAKECRGAGTRNIAVAQQQACSDAYGAALILLEEEN